MGAAMATSPGDLVDSSLQELCLQLRARRLWAEISVESPGGEPDVRLEVRRGTGGDVTVELLGPDVQVPSRTWDAVRIEDGSRAVWRGPARSCSLDDLRCFVQALLGLGAAQLSQLYTYLG